MPDGINIKFPFEETTEGGVFAVNKTTAEAVRDDLVALLTLRRGQRPMQSRLFSPVYDFLHEPLDNITQNQLRKELIQKVEEFIPQVDIKKILFSAKPEENLLAISIRFGIKELFGAEQTIVLSIPAEEVDAADILQ